MQLSLEGAGGKLEAPQKPQQPEGTVRSEAGQKQYERHKRWVQANLDKAREHARNWYHRNKADVAIRRRGKKQKPSSRESRRRFYLRHAERLKAKSRAFSQSERGRAYAAKYQRLRRKENPRVHFMNWLRGSINRSLREQGAKKLHRTLEYVGCTSLELRRYLEGQFTAGMTWNIPRSWDVDHIVPVTAFDLNDEEESMLANNFRNLRPLDRMENKHKSDTIPDPLPSWLPLHIQERIKLRRA